MSKELLLEGGVKEYYKSYIGTSTHSLSFRVELVL
jgi:hypothetical protein